MTRTTTRWNHAPTLAALGDQLQEHRKSLRCTQGELGAYVAAALNVSTSTMEEFIRSKVEFTSKQPEEYRGLLAVNCLLALPSKAFYNYQHKLSSIVTALDIPADEQAIIELRLQGVQPAFKFQTVNIAPYVTRKQ